MKDKNNLFFIAGGIILAAGIVMKFCQVQPGIHVALLGFILLCAGFFRLLSVPKPHIDMSKQPKPFHGDFADNPRAGLSGGCMGNCGSCMSSGGCAVMTQKPSGNASAQKKQGRPGAIQASPGVGRPVESQYVILRK